MVHEVAGSTLWKNARYDPDARRGKLPHESSRGEFSTNWSQVKKEIRTAANVPIYLNLIEESPYGGLTFWWPSLMADSLFDEVDDAILRSQLYHCHAFCQCVGRLEVLTSVSKCKQEDPSLDDIDQYASNPVDRAEGLWRRWQADKRRALLTEREPSFEQLLEEEFKEDVLFNALDSLPEGLATILGLRWPLLLPSKKPLERRVRGSVKRTIHRWLQRASTALGYVSDEAARFYFGKAREYLASEVLIPIPQFAPEDSRLKVFDLPSLAERSTRLLVVNAILNDLWVKARAAWTSALDRGENEDLRVPTFIVVDEAHNLIPSEPRGRAEVQLCEQFRRIAAEGRKYGLFLILASQRPDKLDPFILSECDNKALMRLNSESVLEVARKLLGLEDIPPRILEKSLEAGLGRVMLTGRWAAEGPQWTYCAARRTVEGGRNLRPEHWAKPAETKSVGVAKKKAKPGKSK